MKLVTAQNRIQELMSRFVVQIEMGAAMSRTDLNKAAETILIPLLNEVYGWSLENINYAEGNNNFPGIDLADKIARIAIQVTATPTLDKVKHTLEQFIKHNQYLKYDRLIIYILKEKQDSYSKKTIQEIIQNKFNFDPQNDILDYHNILQEVANFQIDRTLKVQKILEAYFGESKECSIDEASLQQIDSLKFSFLQNEGVPLLEENFVGREQIIEELITVAGKSRVIAILGIPNIGKTALMKRLANDSRLGEQVFWHDFLPNLSDDLQSTLIHLGNFIDHQKRMEGKLLATLRSPTISNHERSILLIEELNKGCYYLFFDQIHQIEKGSSLDSFLSLLVNRLKQGCVFVASRQKPFFYKPTDVTKQVVKVVELDGLRDPQEIQQLFKLEGVSLDTDSVQEIDKRFGGLPFALQLVVTLLKEGITEQELIGLVEEQTVEHLFNEIYARLDQDEKEVLQVISLFSLPCLPDSIAIAYRGIFKKSGSAENLTKLKQKFLVRKFASKYYQVPEAIETLCFNHIDEMDRRLVELADCLISYMPEEGLIRLEPAILYYRAKEFDKAADEANSLLDAGLITYHPKFAQALLKGFREEIVSSEKWVWLLGNKGYLAYSERRLEEAEEYYQKMLKLSGEIQNKTAAAVAFQRLGIIYHDRDDKRAEDYYCNSRVLKEESQDLEGVAQIYSQLGSLYINQGRLDEAYLSLQDGLSLLVKINAPEWKKIWIYGNLGHLFAEQKNWISAIQFAEKVCQIATEMDMPYELASGIYDLGLYAMKQNYDEEAYKWYLKALKIAEDWQLWQIEELVQEALARHYYRLDDYDKAIVCLKRCIEIEKLIDDKPKLATVYINIATFHLQRKDYQKVTEFHELVVDIFEYVTEQDQINAFLGNVFDLASGAIDSQSVLQLLTLLKKKLRSKPISLGLAKVCATIGRIHLEILQKGRLGLAYLRKSIHLLAQMNYRKEQLEVLNNLALAYETLGNYRESIIAHTEIIDLAQILSSFNNFIGMAYYNRANCFMHLELWQNAEDDYNSALRVPSVEEVDHGRLKESIFHNLGEMYRRWGNLDKAVHFLELSLESSRQRGEVDDEILALNNLGLAYEERNQTQTAIEKFNNALELSRQHYRKKEEIRILISLGNFYLVNNQPEHAKLYYEDALTVAHLVEDIGLEEDSMISLASAHRELGTFEDIFGEFKRIAERSASLKHWNNLTKFLLIGGLANLEKGDVEESAEMLKDAICVSSMILFNRFNEYKSFGETSFIYQDLNAVINHIIDSLTDAVMQGNAFIAKALYDQLASKFQNQNEVASSIFEFCLEPIGKHLEQLTHEIQHSSLNTERQ